MKNTLKHTKRKNMKFQTEKNYKNAVRVLVSNAQNIEKKT